MSLNSVSMNFEKEIAMLTSLLISYSMNSKWQPSYFGKVAIFQQYL